MTNYINIDDIKCPYCKRIHDRSEYIKSKKRGLNCVICPTCSNKF